MKDSFSFFGARSAGIAPGGSEDQLSFWAIRRPLELYNSKTGSVSTLATPTSARDGPIARKATFFATLPVTINPPIITLEPLSTPTRVETLSKSLVGEGPTTGGGVGTTVASGV